MSQLSEAILDDFISRAVEACPFGASEPDSNQCSRCPPGFICRPGEYPYPCPLGQYLEVTRNDTGTVNWEGVEYDFFWDYKCVDCPAGHKCGFAASEPVPCPDKSYNSHTGQMICQECIPEFGEECTNAATYIKDTLASKCFPETPSEYTNRFKSFRLAKPKCQEKCHGDSQCVGFHWTNFLDQRQSITEI